MKILETIQKLAKENKCKCQVIRNDKWSITLNIYGKYYFTVYDRIMDLNERDKYGFWKYKGIIKRNSITLILNKDE